VKNASSLRKVTKSEAPFHKNVSKEKVNQDRKEDEGGVGEHSHRDADTQTGDPVISMTVHTPRVPLRNSICSRWQDA